MNKPILIQAFHINGYYLVKLKDFLQLTIESDGNITYIACSEERENGIYVFYINDSISPFARVFVNLKQDVLLQRNMLLSYHSESKIPSHIYNINKESYILKKPSFSHPECLQINFVETMCNTSKPVPFAFITLHNEVNIGIIKAYKSFKNTTTFPHITSPLEYPHHEVYTLDTEQEIKLQAFLYERQRTKSNGNITKQSKAFSLDEALSIAWAFKIVDGSYLADKAGRKTAHPILGKKEIFRFCDNKPLDCIPQGYVEIEDRQGANLIFKLSDIFSQKLLDSKNPHIIIGKNIIFFAYEKNRGINTSKNAEQNAYRLYNDSGRGASKRVSLDRVTSIELKILQTRWRVECDGKTLSLRK